MPAEKADAARKPATTAPARVPLTAAAPGDGNVGVIFGNVGTTEFRFAVNDVNLKRLDYVKARHETDGIVLAQVTEITRESSLSFEQAAEIAGGFSAQNAAERLTARAKVIGYRDARGLLQVPRTPFRAGEILYWGDDALISSIFGLRDKEGAYLGFVKGYELPVHLDINTLVQKHVSVLAKTGSGKSYVVGVVMEELIKRGIPIVVIDPHGEHASLSRVNANEDDYPSMRRFGVKPRAYAEHIIEYSPDTKLNPDAQPLKLDGTGLGASELAECLPGLSAAQMGLLHSAVRELAEEKKDYEISEVLARVKNASSNTKWNLVSALENLLAIGIFAEQGTPVEGLVKRDKVSILNLKGVAPDVQELTVATVARKLFDARKAGKIPPFMLVVEEAHNFCPERGLHAARSGDVLRTIASEGRKFGMGLTVVSQRPAKVDKNVLSQCNTQLILKVTNPNDLKAITASVEGLTADTEDEIQRIPVGVAIVSHPRISMPIMVEIRPRETAHGGQSVDVMKSVAAEETFLTRVRPARPDAAGSGSGSGSDDDEEDEDTAKDAEATAPPPPKPARPPAPVARQARLPPAPAPEPLPQPGARREAPRAGIPLPPWVAGAREDFAAVAEADLARWDEEAVAKLARDLEARLADLRALPPEHQRDLAELILLVDRRLADAQEIADRAERRRNSLVGRLFSRRKAEASAEEAPPAARKPAKRVRLGAELPKRRVKAAKKPKAKRKGASRRGR